MYLKNTTFILAFRRSDYVMKRLFKTLFAGILHLKCRINDKLLKELPVKGITTNLLLSTLNTINTNTNTINCRMEYQILEPDPTLKETKRSTSKKIIKQVEIAILFFQ